MRRLTIYVAAFLLSAWVSFAQDTSGAKQSRSAPEDSTDSARHREKPTDERGEHHNYRLRLGTITVGGGYFSGPLYPYGPYGWYSYPSAAFWDPFWGPYNSFGHLPSLAYGHEKGEVKLTADPKQAEVHIDGAYAGTVDHLKNIWLDPGAYDLSVSYSGRESFHQRIYVLTGKSLKITAKLAAQNPSAEKGEKKQ